MLTSDLERWQEEVAKQDEQLRALLAERTRRREDVEARCRARLPQIRAASAAAREELQQREALQEAQGAELQACELELCNLEANCKKLQAAVDAAETDPTGLPVNEAPLIALRARLEQAESDCEEAQQELRNLQASLPGKLQALSSEAADRKAQALSPLRSELAALQAELRSLDGPLEAEGEGDSNLVQKVTLATKQASSLRDACGTLERRIAELRCKRLAAQRRSLALEDAVLEEEVRRNSLQQQLRTRDAEVRQRRARLEVALEEHERQANDTKSALAEQRLQQEASKSEAAEASSREARELRQRFKAEVEQRMSAARENCKDWAARCQAAAAEKVLRAQQRSERDLAASERRLEEELQEEKRQAEAASFAGVNEEGRLEATLQALRGQAEAARAEASRAQKEWSWLSSQLNDLRKTEGELRLEETELRSAQLPQLEAALQQQRFEGKVVMQELVEAGERAKQQKAQLSEELWAVRMEAAEELFNGAATQLSTAAAAAGDSLVAPATGHGGTSGVGIAGDVIHQSGKRSGKSLEESVDGLDSLLFSGDEGQQSLPPTPSELTPSGTGELKWLAAASATSGAGLQELVGGEAVGSGSAVPQAAGEAEDLKELDALRAELREHLDSAARDRQAAESLLQRARSASPLRQVGIEPPSQSGPSPAQLEELQAQVLRLRSECDRLMDLNNGLHCQLQASSRESPLPGRAVVSPEDAAPEVESFRAEELRAALKRLTDQNRALREELRRFRPSETSSTADEAAAAEGRETGRASSQHRRPRSARA